VSTESARDTKDRILDAAEQLFASQGFAATSLRQITTAAEVNLAAVNYHFQTKDLLVEAVVRRKLGPINARRTDMLDALESQMPEVVPSLEEVLKAFVQPVLDASLIGIELGAFPLVMGRLLSTPDEWATAMLDRTLGEVRIRFGQAIRRGAPRLRHDDLAWAMHFSAGVIAYHLCGGAMLRLMGGRHIDLHDQREAVERMVTYMAEGIRAMAAKAEHA
jgi:AcrR family transcriptional regulator